MNFLNLLHFVDMSFGDGKEVEVDNEHKHARQEEGDNGRRNGIKRTKINLTLRSIYIFFL